MRQEQPGRNAHTRMLAFHDIAVEVLEELRRSQGWSSIDAVHWAFEFGLNLREADPELAELTLREIQQEREGPGPGHWENYRQGWQDLAQELKRRAQAIADGQD